MCFLMYAQRKSILSNIRSIGVLMSDYASDFITYFEGHRDYYVEQVFDVLEAVKNAKEGI